ncbi:MAG: IPTL-CTERM sorting domain-containing protein [Chitinophagales bacterium]
MNNFYRTMNFSPAAQLNFKWLRSFCLIFLFSFSSQSIYSQCTINTINATSTIASGITSVGQQSGQTFLACADGEITSISIVFRNASIATYELYIETEPAAGNPLPAIPLATVVETTGFSGENQVTFTFNLTTPFPIQNDGTIYRFAVAGTAGDFQTRRTYDDYPDGNVMNQSNVPLTSDMDFEISVQPSSAAPASIPTLSEWGLIILALSFMTLGTLYLVQPSVRSSLEQEG